MSIDPQAVIVSDESFGSDDPYRVVYSNITFVNALFEEYFTPDEVAPDALRGYYVDYYLAQMNNGGFSQWVYNTGGDARVYDLVQSGLVAVNAPRHRAPFDQGIAAWDKLGSHAQAGLLASEYWGENRERDFLNDALDGFFDLFEQEDLIALNAAWLRGLPHLQVLTILEMEAEIARRVAALPDREQRIADARRNEPPFEKLIRALCEQAGHELDRITAGSPAQSYKGATVFAWHFLTSQGHFYLVEDGAHALMIDDAGDTVAQVDIDSTLAQTASV